LAVCAGTSSAAEGDTLDAVLMEQAPQILKYLRDHKYQNVGVLKFRVKQGEALSDNVGPLNLTIANRLEVALVLANDPQEPVGIIERASNAVFRSPPALRLRASYLTEEGRRALFQVSEYRLPWGNGKPVEPNAFLTGIVEFSDDWRQMTVTVKAFDRTTKEDVDTVCTFTAPVDFRTLAESGRSYQLGTRGPNESELLAQAIDHSQRVEKKTEKSPLETGQSPVELKVLYNGQEVPVVDGRVREPQKGEKVTFVLTNRTNDRHSVVLKVNGENTLFREPYEPTQCHKWILEPRNQPEGWRVEVTGFQMSATRSDPFEVRSPAESERDAVYYGEHAGTFSLVVFREAPERQEVRTASYDLAAVTRGTLAPNGQKPGTLSALQSQLRAKEEKNQKEDQSTVRGIIVPAQTSEERAINYKPFKSDSIPILVATIRYWQPRQPSDR
jgi:hypothetical protein